MQHPLARNTRFFAGAFFLFLSGCSSAIWTPATKPSLSAEAAVQNKLATDKTICRGRAAQAVENSRTSTTIIIASGGDTNLSTSGSENPAVLEMERTQREMNLNQIYRGAYTACMDEKGWVLRSQEEYDALPRPSS